MSYTYEALSPGGHQEMLEEVFSKVREQVGSYKTASGSLVSFSDGADLPMPSFVCNIDAVQDLHGYDGPWVGGAGKNKLPLTLDNIKALNSAGTWNENVYTTVYGMTYTVNTDDDGNVTDIEANGTPSGNAQLTLTNNTTFLSGSFIGNGCPSGGGSDKYRIRFAGGLDGNDYGSQSGAMTADPNTAINVYIRVDAGVTVDHLKFYPMIRLSTETDPTFAPYSNICPITGHTGVDAWVRGKNLANPATVTTLYPTGDSGTYQNQIRNSSNIRSVIAEVTPNTTYTISKKAGKRFRLAFTEEVPAVGVADMGYESKDTRTSITVTSPSNAKYIVVMFWNGNEDTDTEEDMLATLQIELGETATTYEPYNPNSQTISVSWQTEAGEVFGGYIDLVSGELTVDKAGVDMGSLSWNYDGTRFDATLTGMVASGRDKGICSIYPISLTSVANAPDHSMIFSNNGNTVYVKDSDYTDAAIFTTAMTGQTICYDLAEAQTYQLTPQQIKSLLGNNNAWCSTGSIKSLQYQPNNIIAELRSEILALQARVEELEQTEQTE